VSVRGPHDGIASHGRVRCGGLELVDAPRGMGPLPADKPRPAAVVKGPRSHRRGNQLPCSSVSGDKEWPATIAERP
jgi:hypothetical protein